MKHFNKLAALGLLLAGSLTANAINVTFRVSDADAVQIDLNGEMTTLQAGDNKFDWPEYTHTPLSQAYPHTSSPV